MEQEQLRFPGFPEKPKENYWQYPEIMNGFWHSLTPVEQKILDYILRHTWGWHKNSDYISYSQIKNGIPNVDKGTGIKTDKTISKGLKGLIEKNIIKRVSGKEKGITNSYSLVIGEGLYKVKRGSVRSKEGSCAQGSIQSKDTIDNAINTNNRYASFKKKLKPYFRGEQMRKSRGKWWVLPDDGSEWLEFAAPEKEIEWK